MTENRKYSYKNECLSVKYNEEENAFEMLFFGAHFIGERMVGRVGKSEAKILRFEIDNGDDHLGDYERVSILFESEKRADRIFSGAIRFYDGFTVVDAINHFTITQKKNKHIFGHPYISFPCFEGEEWQDGLSMLSFKRQAPFNYPEQWQGKVTDSLRDGKNTPLIITDSNYHTVIVSPFNHFLYGTVSISKQPSAVRCGLPRALKEIPEGTSYKTIIVYGKGVNCTIDRYGELLRKESGVEKVGKTQDASLKYISYWTNAGSAYWYNVYKCTSYEETLKKLKEHHDKIGLKIGLYQLDSWWYKRDGNNYISSITEWEPKECVKSKNFNSMFPFLQSFRNITLFTTNRMSYVQSLLNKPIGTHFKQISNLSLYIKGSQVEKNNTNQDLSNQYEFIKEKFAVPRDYENAYGFFKHIFDHPKWRLSLVIHDWLNLMALYHTAFRDINVGPAYFKGLDDALIQTKCYDNEVKHVTLQLCMEVPSITLNSVTMKSVTSLRSTSDSNSFMIEGTKRWWWHLFSSRFINAMGKHSFFDNRFSYKNYLYPMSAYSKFEFIWLGLSCGPIGIGDPIGRENMELINRVINTEGEIIKPDEPCVPLDQCFVNNPHHVEARRGATVYTYSSTGGYKSFYILSFNCHPYARKVAVEFSLGEIDSLMKGDYIMYNYFSGTTACSNEETKHLLHMKRRQFYYHIVSPILRGRAVIGDVSKHVSMSSQIIKGYQIKKNSIDISLGYTESSRCHLLIFSKSKPMCVFWGMDRVGENSKQGPNWHYDIKNSLVHIFNSNISEGEHKVKVIF